MDSCIERNKRDETLRVNISEADRMNCYIEKLFKEKKFLICQEFELADPVESTHASSKLNLAQIEEPSTVTREKSILDKPSSPHLFEDFTSQTIVPIPAMVEQKAFL